MRSGVILPLPAATRRQVQRRLQARRLGYVETAAEAGLNYRSLKRALTGQPITRQTAQRLETWLGR